MNAISTGKKVSTAAKPGNISFRERLKLAGFRWNKASRSWVMSEGRFIEVVGKALQASMKPYETPALYASDPQSAFLLSLWSRNFGGGVLLTDRADLSEARECAVIQRCCDRTVVVSDKPDNDAVSFRYLSEHLDEILSPGMFVIFDGVPSRKTVAFEACAVLSLATCFRAVVLDPFRIKNIEDVQNAVLLADPGVSPPYEFYRDHIVVKNDGQPYSSKAYRNLKEFVSKVSPVVGRACDIKIPSPVPVSPKPAESALFYLAKTRYTGAKSARLAELSLVDAVSAGAEMGEEIPADYVTAKQEKAEAARKRGFAVYSKFGSEKRPEKNVLSMTVDSRCDCFLYALGLEEKKAKEKLSLLELLGSFNDIRN